MSCALDFRRCLAPHSTRRASQFGVALFLGMVALASGASAAEPFRPSPRASLAELERLVAARSPTAAAARGEEVAARFELEQSGRWENPTLDAGWGTIPIGETNPAGLGSPLARIPNYSLGLAYTIPIGKRGPRQRRAAALVRAAGWQRVAVERELAFELVAVLGHAALAQLRAEGARELVRDASATVELAKLRVRALATAPLDVDRLELERARLDQLRATAEAELAEHLAGCAGLVARPCAAFESGTAARAFLARWSSVTFSGRPEDRAEVHALAQAAAAAREARTLAAATTLPDPTVRVGYLHDRFVISGNQQNSVNVSVSLPLPLLDGGQTRANAAAAQAASLEQQRHRLRDAIAERQTALLRSLSLVRARLQAIQSDVLPRARAVLDAVAATSDRGLLPISDLILARRAVGELLLEEAAALGDAFEAAVHLRSELATGGEAAVAPTSGRRP